MGEPAAEIERDRAKGADGQPTAHKAKHQRGIRTFEKRLRDWMSHGLRLSLITPPKL
jgi:hypothetical protein